jgi:hypothetical protein
MKEASDRDKLAYQNAMNLCNKGAQFHGKELNEDASEQLVNAEDAIYDNGNTNTKDNKFRAKILANENLSEEEKRRMLQAQEENLNQIIDIMDADRKRQEQELDRVLKERLERRRRLKEKAHKKDIQNATKAAEKALDEEYA